MEEKLDQIRVTVTGPCGPMDGSVTGQRSQDPSLCGTSQYQAESRISCTESAIV